MQRSPDKPSAYFVHPYYPSDAPLRFVNNESVDRAHSLELGLYQIRPRGLQSDAQSLAKFGGSGGARARHTVALGQGEPIQARLVQTRQPGKRRATRVRAGAPEFRLQNAIAMIGADDDGDVERLPRERPQRLKRVLGAAVGLKADDARFRGRYRSPYRTRNALADGTPGVGHDPVSRRPVGSLKIWAATGRAFE